MASVNRQELKQRAKRPYLQLDRGCDGKLAMLYADAAAGTANEGKTEEGTTPPDVVLVSQVACRQRLAGLLKLYYREAA